MIDEKIEFVRGSGGGGDKPKIEPNTLQAQTTARIVDLLCEGEIEGPANFDNWMKSTYYDETQVLSDIDTPNWGGVTIAATLGTTDQGYLPGFDQVEVETTVNTKVLKYSPISKTISDSDVDDVRVTIQVPGLFHNESDGDMRKTTLKYEITVTPDNGAGQETIVVNWTPEGGGILTGKTTSTYRKQHEILNLPAYGVSPWVIKVRRVTKDSDAAQLQNDMYWFSYTTVKNVRMQYPDSVIVGSTIDAKLFSGSAVPRRAWKIKGRKIKYPSNYSPSASTYTGIWDGTFDIGYCNNPAWVVYDMLTNTRFGVGLAADNVDKWTLYTIAQYCDALVDVTSKTRNNDGTYNSTVTSEKRFTFNGVINNSEQALAVINHLSSVFRGFPIWTSGYVSFVQDRPRSKTRIANKANVVSGQFEYEGTAKSQKITAAKVMYNNPDQFGKLETVVIEDDAGIRDFGYNPTTITCMGCISRSEAVRRAKYILKTDLEQGEAVHFRGSMEWADCLPGEIIGIQDADYANVSLGGRVTAATTTSITTDREVELKNAITYTLYVTNAQTSDLIEKVLTNSPSPSATVLTWSGAVSAAPIEEAVWVLTSSDVAIREFEVIKVAEVETNEIEISGISYNANKYAEVEDGLVVEPPPTLDIPVGEISPPSNLQLQPYTYVDGDKGNRKFAIMLSWTASPDPRVTHYQTRFAPSGGAWEDMGTTPLLSYDWRDLKGGDYDISVRATALTGVSTWITIYDFTLDATLSIADPPTNLQVKGGGTTFDGPDCEIEWTGSLGAQYVSQGSSGGTYTEATSADTGDFNVLAYVVEVYTVGDALLRQYTTASKEELEYIYTYAMNFEDNSGSPIRQIKFKVHAIDLYNIPSTDATLVASNPAPDMSSTLPVVTPRYGYLKAEWAIVNDNDMDYYKIYADTFSPPTTEIAQISHPTIQFNVDGVTSENLFYIQIEPYDGFGVGVKSQIPDPEAALKITDVDISGELSSTITATDSEGTSAADLAELYDRIYDTGGITYSLSGIDKWIQYEYELENYFDRVAVWTDNPDASAYVAVYNEDDDQWWYFQDAGDSENLVLSVAVSAAQANLWDLDAVESGGTRRNLRVMPANVAGTKFRLYLRGTFTTTLREFLPSRILISELAAIEELSAITANIGTVIAGVLQSESFSSSGGVLIDLDDVTPTFDIIGGVNDYMKFDGLNVDFSSTQEDAITIKIGADIRLESATGGATGNIKFVGNNRTYYMGADYDNDRLAIYSDTDDQGILYFGYNAEGIEHHFSNIYMGAEQSIEIRTEDTTDPYQYSRFYSDAGVSAYVEMYARTELATEVSFRVYSTHISCDGNLEPNSDSTKYLGGSTKCWARIYSDAGTQTCSDRKYKTNIKTTSLGLDFINALVPVEFEWNKEGERPKNHDGTYHGLIAPDVEQALIEVGYDLDYFGGIEIDKDEKGEDWYGLKYEQFISPLIKAIQELSEEIEELKRG